jgi:putative transposase
MKKSQFTPEQITFALRQAVSGTPILEVCRKMGIAEQTFYKAFNGRLRKECLNESWFLSMEDARDKVEAWRKEYNGNRPHGALGNLAPEEFVLVSGRTK